MENLSSLYLLYGEENFLLENNLKKIKNSFGECVKGINYITLDEENIQQIISDIETPSFGYEKKLIVAKNTGFFGKEAKKKVGDISKLKEKLKEKLTEYISNNINIINEAVVLVFVEQEVDAKSDLYKVFEKIGTIIKCDYLKPIELEKWIKTICDNYKVKIDSRHNKIFY